MHTFTQEKQLSLYVEAVEKLAAVTFEESANKIVRARTAILYSEDDSKSLEENELILTLSDKVEQYYISKIKSLNSKIKSLEQDLNSISRSTGINQVDIDQLLSEDRAIISSAIKERKEFRDKEMQLVKARQILKRDISILRKKIEEEREEESLDDLFDSGIGSSASMSSISESDDHANDEPIYDLPICKQKTSKKLNNNHEYALPFTRYSPVRYRNPKTPRPLILDERTYYNVFLGGYCNISEKPKYKKGGANSEYQLLSEATHYTSQSTLILDGDTSSDEESPYLFKDVFAKIMHNNEKYLKENNFDSLLDNKDQSLRSTAV